MDYRDLHKGFVEVDELILAGIDKQKVKDLSMFLTVGSIDSYQMNHPKEVFSNLDHQLFLRTYRVLETQKGYTGNTPSFEGNPYKYYARYSANYYRNLQFGFVLEKDEGESFYQKSNAFSTSKPLAGFDYRNGYFSFKTNSIVKQVIVGAYSLQLGQGLMSWSGMALGKSVYTLQSKRIGTLLRPYSSVNENLFYKGIATHIQLKKWMLLPYVSIKKRDGNMIFQDTTAVSDVISSLQTTGLHRIKSEIEDEASVKETILGLSVGRHWKKIELKRN